MSTVTNATWELQLGVVIAAAELVSAISLKRMLEVTEVARTAPPSLSQFPARDAILRAPLADQQALVAAADHFRSTYEALLDPTTTEGAPS